MAALAAELSLLVALVADLPPLCARHGILHRQRGAHLLPGLDRHAPARRLPTLAAGGGSTASVALTAHWLAAPALIELFPSWSGNAFLLGTVLVLALYFVLLTAVLSQFQTRLMDAESKALELAVQDPLTGLHNQRSMTALFDQALVLATRPHHVVAVYSIDLDNFKPINGTAGHAVGDKMLKAVAARLKGSTRRTDICARVGADDFVVIATQLDDEVQATEIARKLLARLTEGIAVNGKQYALGASIGVALYPKHGRSLAELFQCAGHAMYHVKRNGKSGCEVFGGAPPCIPLSDCSEP
ncbi:diguanylate cyclase domain-containing protein [Pseudoduganella sp. UC29_71]|uniref:diguanylate cyclase domain-containing protein n=1 Tax=Pseudoduganella sp. UC29_71 TaxID=3350174 RepID=UPI003671BD77